MTLSFLPKKNALSWHIFIFLGWSEVSHLRTGSKHVGFLCLDERWSLCRKQQDTEAEKKNPVRPFRCPKLACRGSLQFWDTRLILFPRDMTWWCMNGCFIEFLTHSLFLTCRNHHSAHHVHNRHWCECLHAPGVLRQGSGRVHVGQLPLCVSVSHWVCSSELSHHSGRVEATQPEKKGTALPWGSAPFKMWLAWFLFLCCDKIP